MKFEGYPRPDGRVGIRNHVLIFPTVICASAVAQMIQRAVPETVCVSHSHGCGHLGEERDHMVRTMAGFCGNPNVAGVLLVGLGCELITPEVLFEKLKNTGQKVEILSIQVEGGTTHALEKGKMLARILLDEAEKAQRESVDINRLIVGTHCGASDTMSGISSNPALGVACDLLIDCGGTVILTETPEMLGAEHILAKRASDAKIKEKIFQITESTENKIKSAGVDIRGAEPSPGNIEGGLTTLEEKSLGAIRKGGTTPIIEVVEYAQRPEKNGLVIMDGPAHDVVSNTGMLAAGAQLIAFTTGRGTPVGTPIAPVIKISSNSTIHNVMPDNIDINAGAIIDGEETINGIGEKIFGEMIGVASGKKTCSELLGHSEFAIHTIGPTV